MKTIYSNLFPLTAALLLGLAFSFASCTKESLPVPQLSQNNSGKQKQVTTLNVSSVTSTVRTGSDCSKAGGGGFTTPTPMGVSVSAVVLQGNKKAKLRGTLYFGDCSAMMIMCQNEGIERIGLRFEATPLYTYHLQLSTDCGYGQVWIGKISLDQLCIVQIPGLSCEPMYVQVCFS
jgi:hypothetical protein